MNAAKTLRMASLVEGASLLVLLGVAMPLKYIFGYPAAVRVVGSLHGACFLWFLAALLRARNELGVPLKTSLKLLAAACLPLGFVLIDRARGASVAATASREPRV